MLISSVAVRVRRNCMLHWLMYIGSQMRQTGPFDALKSLLMMELFLARSDHQASFCQ